MDIFLSWSGNRSKECALALRKWLFELFPMVTPWLSEEDIRKGKPWNDELKQALSKAKFGIICITPSNIGRQWLLYEAGALAYAMDDPYVATFLLALGPTDLSDGPLSLFQHTVFAEDDVRRLAHTINCVLPTSRYEGHELQKRLKEAWPLLMNELTPIARSYEHNTVTGKILSSTLDSPILPGVKLEKERLSNDVEKILRTLADQPHLPMGALQISSILTMHQTKARVCMTELQSRGYVFVGGTTIDGDAYRITDKGSQYLVQYNLV